MGPGSAAHHSVLRCVRGTRPECNANSISLVVAGATKQSSVLPRIQSGLLRCTRNDGVWSSSILLTCPGSDTGTPKKKAARFPERPFLSHGGCTFTSGDFGASRPGAYLPIESWSAAAAFRDSRELLPEPNAMVSHLRKMGSLSRITRIGATPAQAPSPLFPLSTAAGYGCGCIQSSDDGSPAASQASRAGSRRSPWDACRWRASSRRGGRPSPCRSGSAGAAFPTRAAGS